MHNIDFHALSHNETLFHSCLQPIVAVERSEELQEEKKLMLPIDEAKKRSMENFFFLVDTAANYNYDISKILSKPNQVGHTAFNIAYDKIGEDSRYSIRLLGYMKKFNVEVNFINLHFKTIVPIPEHALIFLKQGVNIKIINK